MANQTIFKRYEIKYMLDANQLSMLKNEMKNYMIADEHGKVQYAVCISIHRNIC